MPDNAGKKRNTKAYQPPQINLNNGEYGVIPKWEEFKTFCCYSSYWYNLSCCLSINSWCIKIVCLGPTNCPFETHVDRLCLLDSPFPIKNPETATLT